MRRLYGYIYIIYTRTSLRISIEYTCKGVEGRGGGIREASTARKRYALVYTLHCTHTHTRTTGNIKQNWYYGIGEEEWNKKSRRLSLCTKYLSVCAISILPNTHAHAETTATESDWRMKAPGGPQITIAFMSSPPRSRAGDRPRDLCAYMLLLRQWLPVAPTSGPNGFSLFYINTHTHRHT